MNDDTKLTQEQLIEQGYIDDVSSDLNPTVDMKVDKEVYHGSDAIAQVEANIGRPLTYAEQRVVEEEGYVATPYTDTKGITTQGVGQTGEWIEKGFEAAYQHHVDRAQSRIPNLGTYPKELQAELIQAEYRGDLGHSPNFIKLLNEGNYNQASLEFLDNKDYRNSLETDSGVHRRMKKVSDAVAAHSEKRRAAPEAAFSKADYDIGTSGYKLVDGDTFRDKETGQSYRFEGIDLAEVEKFLRQSGYQMGEASGQVTKQYVASLANEYGFTNAKTTDKKAGYGRKIGDLVDKDGNSFQNFLVSSGIAKPKFIGKTDMMMSDEDYSRYLYGLAARAGKDPDTKLSTVERAAAIIRASGLENSGGEYVAKKLALNEREYARAPELFSGVVLRNYASDMEGRAIHPMSQSWDSAVTMVGNSFKQVAVMGSDILGYDDAEAYLLGGIAYSKSQLAESPGVRLDYRDVDFTDIGQVGEFLGNNLATSLPFMGVTVASIASAGVTMGGSLTIPVAMYSGMILDEMEGEQDDKSYGIAIAGGAIAAALDVFGIKGAMGIIRPSQFITKEGREEAVRMVMRAQGPQRARAAALLPVEQQAAATARGLSKEQATVALASMTKRQISSYADDAAKFANTQLQKGALVKRLAGRLTTGAAFEGSTEMLQELTQYTAAVLGSEKTWDFDELQHRMTNALIAGGMMGSAFATPGGVWEAGQWKDASVAMAKYDGMFDDATEGYKAEARDDNGRVADLDEVIRQEWEDSKASKAPEATETEAPEGKIKPEGEGLSFTERADAGQVQSDGKTVTENLGDGLKDAGFLLRDARDTLFTKDILDRSPTLRKLYDMMGGRDKKVHGGVDFHSDKVGNFRTFESLLTPVENLYSKFKLEAKGSGAMRKELSTLMYSFFNTHVKPITANEDTNATWMTADQIVAAIDWDNLANPKFQENSSQIKELLQEFYSVDRSMYEGVTARQRQAGEPYTIGDLQDHIFRSKGFLKSAISKNKDKFIQLLVSEKGLSIEFASEITNSLLDNAEIHTLDEAFDLTKGGLVPKTHKRRTLDISDNVKFDEFFEQNLFENTENAMKSASRYMTMTKFVGSDSKLLTSMMEKVYAELSKGAEAGSEREAEANATASDLAKGVRDLINADSGNYKRIESDALRGTQKAITLTATLTMLGLAAPMSLVEFALTPLGVDIKTLNKNVGSLGLILGREMFEYFAEVGRLTRVVPQRSNFETKIKSREQEAARDPRYVQYDDPSGLNRRVGFGPARTGQAQLVGVSETNKMTRSLMDSFFKVIGLNAITNATRTVRASFFNDFLIRNLDIINQGTVDTNEVRESRRHLEKMGIPVDKMLDLSLRITNGDTSPETMAAWERQFDNGLFNFINEAVPLPDAMGRPLFYSDPHLAMFTQFQGFTSKFTAHHIPRMWDSIKNSTPGFRYSTFATLMSMLMLGYAAQHLKDLIKFGESSPYLEDNEKYLRALYSSGILGTTERVLSNNLLFPLYEDRSRTIGEAVWNFGTGEAPASGIFENVYKLVHGVIEGDSRATVKSGVGLVPVFAPFKHHVYNNMVEAQWITGDDY